MANIFHHSRAYIMKHQRHHHLVIALLAILIAGTSGVFLYKKFAQAATHLFNQTNLA